MIGGIDIPIPTRAGAAATEVAVRIIRRRWPRAVFEDGLTGESFDRFAAIPFGIIEELFVYRDPDAARLWNAEGAVAEAHNMMIHLIADPDMVTVVIDERDEEMNSILDAVRAGLDDEIFFLPALLEAA